MTNPNDIGRWIFDHLTVRREHGAVYVDPDDKFPNRLCVYTTPIVGPLLATLMEDRPPAPFKTPPGHQQYNWLIRLIARETSAEPAYWFYGTDPDNETSSIHSVIACNYGHGLNQHLELFETQPGFQGGSAFLGLLPESKQWLLFHRLDQGSDFRIDFFGSLRLCEKVAQGLGLTNEPQK